MNLYIPKDLLDWLDQNRGALSRQAFIIQCAYKIMEIAKIKELQPRK